MTPWVQAIARLAKDDPWLAVLFVLILIVMLILLSAWAHALATGNWRLFAGTSVLIIWGYLSNIGLAKRR